MSRICPDSLSQITDIILDNAERIDPDIWNSQLTDHVDGVLKRLWKSSFLESPLIYPLDSLSSSGPLFFEIPNRD
jgi:hypothetical protein